MIILLMGLRGCGKSTVGRALARHLHQPFIDLDDRTLARCGEASVREVFVHQGEAAWREAEAAALADVLSHDEQIIALGGGTPTVDAARVRIDACRAVGRARTVYLRCRTETLVQRLATTPGDRPPLTDLPAAEEIEALLRQREPAHYLPLSDLVVDADEASPDELAQQIAEALDIKRG